MKIHLHKQILLGSWRSSAALYIKANELLIKLLNLELEKIYFIADCPFFIDNRPKLVKGIGEDDKY